MPTSTTPPILCPVRSPYDIAPCDPSEIAPLVTYLETDTAAQEQITFPRGTVLPDGRLDLCKQSLGPENTACILQALRGNTKIRSLLLGTDGIGDTGAAEVASLVAENSSLEIVYLGCNQITDAGTARLCDALGDNKGVTGLWLKRNPLGPAGARHVADLLRRNQTIRTLDLVNTDPGPEGVALILDALIEENRTVERLYLGGNGIGPEAAPLLATLLRENSTLTSLLLNVSPLGDTGLREMAPALRENHTLTDLGLASCGLTGTGGEALFDALTGHPTLANLDLGRSPSTRVLGAEGNALQNRGAFAAAAFLQTDPPLYFLDLRRNGIAVAGRERLRTVVSEHNRHLCYLLLDGSPDEALDAALARNREAAQPNPGPPSDVALIRSVYRTAPRPAI